MVKMGYVWDRMVEFLGDSLGALMPIIILAIFVPTSISGSLEALQATAGPGLKLALGILGLVFAILSLWAGLAIAALAIDSVDARRASAIATARLWPAIGVYLLLLIALFVLLTPIVVLMVAAGVNFSAMQASGTMPTVPPGTALSIVAYAIVLFIVMLFVAARLAPLTAVLVAERRGVGAIGRAFALTRGLTWKLVGVIILYAVVTIVATLAARTVFGSVLGLVAGGQAPLTVASVITAVVVAAVSTGFTVLAAAFCAKLYVAIMRANETAVTAEPPPYDPTPHDPTPA